jgi:TonB family protein
LAHDDEHNASLSAAMAQEPTTTATCSPDRQATVVRAVAPDYPQVLRQMDTGPLTTLILVTINPDGSIKSLAVQKSSGYYYFDVAAKQAARASEYIPRIVGCKPVTGTYIFRAEARPIA